MTNEKFLEKIYGIIKAIDENRNSYGQVGFDGSSVDNFLKKWSEQELAKSAFNTPELAFAKVISEIQQEIRETENKKKAGKNGAAKVKALNNILKAAPESKPILKYASIQQVNGKTMQVFIDGYHAVALSETDMIETEQIPKSMEGYEPFKIQQAIPTSGIIGTYKINTNALKALYKAKSAEWKTYKGKCDDKAPCLKWNEKVGYNLDYLMDCVNGLNADSLIMEDYGDLAVKVLRNGTDSFALVSPIMVKPKKGETSLNLHKWAVDSEVDGIFEEIQ